MIYTIVLQNTTSRKVYFYNLEDEGSVLYYKFNISVGDIPDGEYQWILFENPDNLAVMPYTNNITESELLNATILVHYNEILTDELSILIVDEGETRSIDLCATGLMHIGDYNANNTEYAKEKQYKTYSRD